MLSEQIAGDPAYPVSILKRAINTSIFAYSGQFSGHGNGSYSREIGGYALINDPEKNLFFEYVKDDYRSEKKMYRCKTRMEGYFSTSICDNPYRSKRVFSTLSEVYHKLVDRKDSEFSREVQLEEEAPIIIDLPTDAVHGFKPDELKLLDAELVPALRRGQAEPFINPFLLLYYFSENISKLNDFNLRNIFLLSFFKTILVPSKGIESPLKLCLSDPTFIERLKEFLKQGFIHYRDKQAGGKPSHEECLFLSLLAISCRYMAFDSKNDQDPLEHLSPEAQFYIEREIEGEIPVGLKLQAHLIRLFTIILITPKTKESSKTALIEWIKYNSLKGKAEKEHRIDWFENVVSSVFYLKLPLLLELAQTEIHSIAKEVFGSHMSEAYKAEFWKPFESDQFVSSQVVASSKSNKSTFIARSSTDIFSEAPYLIIDFAQATVANQDGILLSGRKPFWFDEPLFKSFFGDETPEYTLSGQYCLISFKGASFKAFHALDSFQENGKWLSSFQIQESDGGFFYVEPQSLLKGLPETLARRYWFFYDKKKRSVAWLF